MTTSPPEVGERAHDAATYTGLYTETPEQTKTRVLNEITGIRTKYQAGADAIPPAYRAISGVPLYVTAISPNPFIGAPSAPVTLIVTGAGFTATSKVQVGVTERTTAYDSPNQLTATFNAPAATGVLDVTVVDGNTRSNVMRMTFTLAAQQEGPQSGTTPDMTWLKADIVAWLLTQGVDLDEPALTNLTKAELLTIVADVQSPPAE